MLQVLDENDVRRIAREEAQRPTYVTQRTVEAVVGLPRRTYLRAANADAFPTTSQHRLVIARTTDVLAWVELHLRATANGAPANDADTETLALAKVGARRVSR